MKITLKILKKSLKNSWDRDTCHYKFTWDDKSLPLSAGQCRVTSLIVQDYFGGNILYTHVKNKPKWDHYYNKLPTGKIVDFTINQFPKNIEFVKPIILSRKKVLSSKRTQKGYNLLKKNVKKYLEENK